MDEHEPFISGLTVLMFNTNVRLPEGTQTDNSNVKNDEQIMIKHLKRSNLGCRDTLFSEKPGLLQVCLLISPRTLNNILGQSNQWFDFTVEKDYVFLKIREQSES